MTTCTHCGGIYIWTDTQKGKRPLNQEAPHYPHWETCRGFRKSSRNRGRESWRRKQQRRTASAPNLPATTGNPVPATCADCTAMPWEPCACSDFGNDTVNRIIDLAGQA